VITTPGQTVGPFFGFALPFAGDADLVPAGHPQAVQLTGRVLDGAGEPLPDGLVEVWQSNADGRIVRTAGSLRRDPFTFTGFGRCSTDNAGIYRFTTIRPGTGFFSLTVFGRGLGHRLFTRAYLPGAPDDALLAAVPTDRRSTLRIVEDGTRLRFDIRLQGAGETVFLRFPGQPT
jgi:protocatechuate 3,4-dioxygenase, alpha subunit